MQGLHAKCNARSKQAFVPGDLGGFWLAQCLKHIRV